MSATLHDYRRALRKRTVESFSHDYGGTLPFHDEFKGLMTSGIGRHRDSEMLDESNFDTAKALFEDAGICTRVLSFGHWAVGWVEGLYIPATIAAAKVAREIAQRLESYPVLDEDDYSERQSDAIAGYWERAGMGERIEMCKDAGLSGYAARRDYIPDEVFDTLSENGSFY